MEKTVEKKWLLVSDLDGTLLNSDGSISEENIKAIQTFIQAGNYFTIATGRHYSAIAAFIDQIPVNAPCLLLNGGVRQYPNGQVESAHYLNQEAILPFIQSCIERFNLVEIYTTQDIHLIQPEKTDPFLEYFKIVYKRSKIEDILHEKWVKCAISDHTNHQEVAQFASEKLPSCFHGSNSAPDFYAIMPNNVNKGIALRQLANQLQVKCAAIGDFYNDIEMVTMADIGFAVDNAVDELKAKADKIVAHHEKLAIKEAVEYLMKL